MGYKMGGEIRSLQFGTKCVQFPVGSGQGFILFPTARPKGKGHARPWVWYAPTFVAERITLPKELHQWYISRLLAAGFFVAGVDAGEAWGSPAGRAVYTEFYQLCIKHYGLAPKACLMPQSRGGLFHYNWATEHPQCVQAVGGIYSLVNLLLVRNFMERVLPAYGLDEKTFQQQAARHNPIERLAPLAKYRVPLFHIHGDVDTVVPLDGHVGELAKRYRALGGEINVLVVPDKGHEEVPEFFTSQALLDFFVERGRP